MRISRSLMVVVATGACLWTTVPMAIASWPAASDVPAYKGDAARTGRMPGPCPTEPQLAWTARGGAPFGVPVVIDGTLIAPDQMGVVTAYDLRDGSLRWRRDLSPSDPLSPPIAMGRNVVIGSADGRLHALDASDGALVWTTTLAGPALGSPVIVGDLLLAGTDHVLFRIDPSTGHIRGRQDLPGTATRSLATSSDMIYVPAGEWIVAMDARSGDLLWKERISSGGGVGTPTIQDGGVFAATGLDRADPTAHGISALDALTGALRWRYRTPEDAVLFGPAADESGRAFAVGHDSRVVALDQATGAPIWVVQLDSTMDAAPVVACGDVYVATVGGDLIVLSAADGSLLRSIRIGSRPAGVVVTGGMIVVTTHRGEVVAFADPPAAGS